MSVFHHTNEAFPCPLCDQKLLQAHDVLKEAFKKIKESFKDCHISWSFRGEIDQNLLFEEKKTKARWPKSAHNKNPSRALDLFQLSKDNEAIYNNNYFRDISQFLVKNLIPVEWSGNWTHFREYDHFQLIEEK